MEGVTILNTIYEYAMNFSSWWVGGFFIAALLSLALCAITTEFLSEVLPPIFLSSFIICTVIGFILGICQEETTEIVDTKYQVIIEDSVSFSEFNEHYEIIKQDGQIYTVREIEGK